MSSPALHRIGRYYRLALLTAGVSIATRRCVEVVGMRAGQVLSGRYRLDSRIGGGGMGSVWLATDTRVARRVAAKILHPQLAEDERVRRRFASEARAIAAVDHPGVVKLHDYIEDETDDGVIAYLVMEYVAGPTLRQLLNDRESLPVAETLRLLIGIGEALEAAHQAGIVHRDVKPGNILIDDATAEAKIVDFGIARAHGESGLTSTGVVIGTLSYVSPEQLSGTELTGTADVYSLGVVAYECLTGERPFAGETAAAIMSGHLHQEPEPLPDSIPAPVIAIVDRALAKDPAQRFGSAAELVTAARAAMAGRVEEAAERSISDRDAKAPAVAAPLPALPTTGDTLPDGAEDTTVVVRPAGNHRRRRLAMVTVAVILLLVIAGAFAWFGGDTDTPANADAASSGESDPAVTGDGSQTGESGSASKQPAEDQPLQNSESSESTEDDTSKVALPDVVGMQAGPAEEALNDEGFHNIEMIEVEDDRPCGPARPTKVEDQDPNAGQRIDETTPIKVYYLPSGGNCDISMEPNLAAVAIEPVAQAGPPPKPISLPSGSRKMALRTPLS